ncbi:hypothetical protein WJX74_002880 [Apatococcus lobatus]|uniref:Uridine diphosphate glucose pyrophosphatase NUDT14 n=2 Tax=Apatococcus TaxID=904362 RepID=A0AAW1SZ37_9CHLO
MAGLSKEEMYPYGLRPVQGEGKMEATVERLGKISTAPMQESRFVKTHSILYELDGKERRWDMVISMPSVGVLLYHKDLKAMLVVRQFRATVWCSRQQEAAAEGRADPPHAAGFTYELCAGLVDKEKPLPQVAAEEVEEECGFKVAAEALQLVTGYRSSVGTSGSQHTLFFAEVGESDRSGAGGGLTDDGEAIEVLALPLDRCQDFIADVHIPKSAALVLGMLWLQARINAQQGPS